MNDASNEDFPTAGSGSPAPETINGIAGRGHADDPLPSILRRYEKPVVWKSSWQLINSWGLFLVAWYLAYESLSVSYLATIAFCLVAAGTLVRIGIIQHDCGHGSFLPSRKANEIVGCICGFVTLTPFYMWWRRHAAHHAKTNNLDYEDRGIYSECLTVKRYQALSGRERWVYRITRTPIVHFFILAPLAFLLFLRFPIGTPKSSRKERRNVHLTNIAIVAEAIAVGSMIGFDDLAKVHLPVVLFASAFGLWLCVVQHRFEGAKWFHGPEWNLSKVAFEGTSYLKLTRVLQWFSGNIVIHPIHHLNPRIPNYNLQRCHDETPELQDVHVLTMGSALRAVTLNLWDDERRRLVRFCELTSPRKAHQ